MDLEDLDYVLGSLKLSDRREQQELRRVFLELFWTEIRKTIE